MPTNGFLETTLKIGKVGVTPPIILAPMAENTSYPLRILCKRYGAALTVTEMVTTHPFSEPNRQSLKIVERGPGEKPLAAQICGNEIDLIERCVDNATNLGFEIIDLNLGCPVRRMVSKDYGGGLSRYPDRVERIVAAMTRRTRVPVTVKIRKGYDDKSENAVLLAKIAEDNGAKMVTVHGRTVRQMYSGKADWSAIRRVKEAVKIPVVGNGDIVDGKSAKKMLDETGCDGIMVGRAAVGRPWVFAEIISYLKDGTIPVQLPTEEAQAIIREHFELLTTYAGERKAALLMRKYLCSYTRGLPYSSEFRRKCLDLHGRGDFEALLAQFPNAQTLIAEMSRESTLNEQDP